MESLMKIQKSVKRVLPPCKSMLPVNIRLSLLIMNLRFIMVSYLPGSNRKSTSLLSWPNIKKSGFKVQLKTAVEEVLKCHFGENGLLVVLKSL